VIVKTIKKLKSKENRTMLYKDMALMLALFFNPFGFDAVQYSLLLLTGSLWKANFVLYCIAGLFFGLYIWFTKPSGNMGKWGRQVRLDKITEKLKKVQEKIHFHDSIYLSNEIYKEWKNSVK